MSRLDRDRMQGVVILDSEMVSAQRKILLAVNTNDLPIQQLVEQRLEPSGLMRRVFLANSK